MSKNIILDIENVSKQYRLGEVGTGSLQHDLKRWWYNVRGLEDPFLKIGESNDRTKKGNSDYVWALKDINFQIEQGQAVGIIGRNGAGKSTLLKLLSRVTKPTTGTIKYKGRIASLLEVGTGFHPEMTGRENIYLNGAILGMTRREITRKFDEIVDFAGVERYIDTPVKRYSSGMYVRLAFAVAAHLESEILIVDEVLAVGDAEFQKKCLGKMGDVSRGEGRTVLFVSHNMAAVEELCDFGVMMENGTVKSTGDISSIINLYRNSNIVSNTEYNSKIDNLEKSHIKKVYITDLDNNPTNNINFGNGFKVNIEIFLKEKIRNPIISCRLSNSNNINIITVRSNDYVESPLTNKLKVGENLITLEFKDLTIFNDLYEISVSFVDGNQTIEFLKNIINFEISPAFYKPDLYRIVNKENSSNSILFHEVNWEITQ